MKMRMKNISSYLRLEREAVRRRNRFCSTVCLLVLPLFAAAGCDSLDDLLEVSLPGQVTLADIDNSGLAETLVLGAQGSFECGYVDSIEWYGYWSGDLWGIYFNRPEGFTSQRSSANSIYADPCASSTGPMWTPFQVSLVAGEDAVTRIEGWLADGAAIPDSNLLIGKAHLYTGYSYLLLSEAFCQVAFNGSPLQTREDGFELAEQRFTSAIELAGQASGSDASAIVNAARIGRARARLNLGDGAGVIQDASLVPEGFWFEATYDLAPNRRQNNLWERWAANNLSVPENLRNIEVQGVPDPRTPNLETGIVGGDGLSLWWDQLKYLSIDSNIPLATWREAQLMIAEVEVGQTAVGIINMLRATVEDLPWVTGEHDLPEFASADPAEIEATLREARRRELWLHGTRLGDMLRWGEPFRSGNDHRGRAIFDNTCMPIPDLERFGNPNIPTI